MPWYYGFRIYLSANLLHFFLIIPFSFFIFAQKIPEIAEKKGFLTSDSTGIRGALPIVHDPLDITSEEEIDSLVNTYAAMAEAAADSARVRRGSGITVETEGEKHHIFDKDGILNQFFSWMFYLTLVSYVLGLLYNMPFKRLFIKIRRGREIPEKLQAFCKKHLLHSHLVNAFIVIMPSLLVITYYLIFVMLKEQAGTNLELEAFREFFYLTLIATFLEFLFVFYWQKHRVRQYYIVQVYAPEELRGRLDRKGKGRIRSRLVMASAMTTLLPLLVVLSYLIQSLTKVKDLGIKEMSGESWSILMGPWGTMIGKMTDQGTFAIENIKWMSYVNATDTLSMFVGISTGIMVSVIYLLFFIRWTNKDITQPVKELLMNMRETRGGESDSYTLVRTSDEIGELAEGYNEMIKKIHEHVEQISRLNRDLEEKVEERTREVVMQKEEIEAQKEEIEAQLDMATRQRDTISRQKDQILDSIRYAERIQSAILPPGDFLSENTADHFVLYMPRDIVSGDFYWTSMVNGKLLLAAADCTGHGVPGAFLSVLGISSMNEIVNTQGEVHPHQVLEQLRTFVIRSMHQSGIRGEAQDGIEIALCMIDLKTRLLEFAGANRHLYLVRRGKKGSTGNSHELIQVRGDRIPIGIYEQEPGPFTNHQVQLMKGDAIYLFSDGYVDQLGGPRRKTFRAVHFRELLLQNQGLAMEAQKKLLLEKHLAWRGNNEQIDDILVMGIRI